MSVDSEGYCGLWLCFAEDNTVDAVFVSGETHVCVLVAVIMPLLPTEYRQREVQCQLHTGYRGCDTGVLIGWHKNGTLSTTPIEAAL